MDATPTIRFDDGAAYEDFMGRWSHSAGDAFLDWLAPPPGLAWLDVGCGNGAFTELLAERCAPARLHGVDPSDGQLAFARERRLAVPAGFDLGDAMALPCADAQFDAAVMALVIFFVPEPARGVAEMVRVVRPGGSVSAYAWDLHGGGFPYEAIQSEMAASGQPRIWPPSADASRRQALEDLWTGAGLTAVETRQIEVERRFDDFDAYWKIAQSGPRLFPALGAMTAETLDGLKKRLRARLGVAGDGRITCRARANAVKGRVAG